jgi:hypothetical protein
MWILIIILSTGHGATSSSVEFKTKKQCVKAATSISEGTTDRFATYTFCVEK